MTTTVIGVIYLSTTSTYLSLQREVAKQQREANVKQQELKML
jgi:hypothetical protein